MSNSMQNYITSQPNYIGSTGGLGISRLVGSLGKWLEGIVVYVGIVVWHKAMGVKVKLLILESQK